MSTVTEGVRIDEGLIARTIEAGKRHDAARVREVLARALELKGLSDADMAVLMGVSDPELLGEVFHTARRVKEDIYGNRLVLFAPLYISNLCGNECVYCAFRARNRNLKRRALSQDEMIQRWGVHAAPTVLFFGRDGREVAERLKGVSPDFYSSYLDQRIAAAQAAVRAAK